ncbi:MAG: hypothetical protein ACLTG4_10485 [Oscillospiraceae bacterium]
MIRSHPDGTVMDSATKNITGHLADAVLPVDRSAPRRLRRPCPIR